MRCCSISLYSSCGKLIVTLVIILLLRKVLTKVSTENCRLYFVNDYKIVQNLTDLSYKIPKEERFRKRKWKHARPLDKKSRNFAIVIRALAEKGSSTIKDIVNTDGYFESKIKLEDPEDTYARIINGNKTNKVIGLIEKRLVQNSNSNKNNRPAKYRLTLFGVFYAIHIFSDYYLAKHQDIEFDKEDKPLELFKNDPQYRPEKSILDAIAKNYSDLLPLIFGKWDFLTKKLRSRVNALVDFSHDPFFSFNFGDKIIYNTRPLTMKKWKSKQGIYADEITLWFYSYFLERLAPNEFKKFISKDKQIYRWYKKYLSLLIIVNRENRFRTQYARFLVRKDLKKAKELCKKINSLQSINQPHFGV